MEGWDDRSLETEKEGSRSASIGAVDYGDDGKMEHLTSLR